MVGCIYAGEKTIGKEVSGACSEVMVDSARVSMVVCIYCV